MGTATSYNGPAGRDGPSSRSISERARKAAAAAGFGAWEYSLRVNGRIDSNDLTNSIMLVFVAPWMFIGLGIFLPDASWGNRGFCIAIGMLFLCVGIVFFRSAWQRRKAGEALIHLFDNGAVLERTKGHIFALPYADTAVDYVLWQESIEGGERPRQHLWITLPDGRAVMLDGWGEEEQQDLSYLAKRWELSSAPRLLKIAPKLPPLW